MSVVSIKKMPKRGLTASDTADAYETYQVITDDRNDNQFTIVNDPVWLTTIQQFNESHPQNPFFTRREIQLDCDAKAPINWIANVRYSTKPITQDERERNTVPNPVDRRLKMGADTVDFQVYRDKDAEGTAYRNSAGDPLEPLPFEDARVVIPVRRNVATWDATWFNYNNTVNDAEVTLTDGKSTLVIAAEYGLFKGFRMSDLQEENGFEYYVASAQIHIASTSDKWVTKRLDQGFYYVSGSDKKRFTVKDNAGNSQDAPTEQLLDGSGGALSSGGTPVFRSFVDFEPADWSSLPFFTV